MPVTVRYATLFSLSTVIMATVVRERQSASAEAVASRKSESSSHCERPTSPPSSSRGVLTKTLVLLLQSLLDQLMQQEGIISSKQGLRKRFAARICTDPHRLMALVICWVRQRVQTCLQRCFWTTRRETSVSGKISKASFAGSAALRNLSEAVIVPQAVVSEVRQRPR